MSKEMTRKSTKVIQLEARAKAINDSRVVVGVLLQDIQMSPSTTTSSEKR